jgi:uncharacterized protein YukE
MKHSWNLFSNSLIRPSADSGDTEKQKNIRDKRVLSTTGAETFFNEESIISPNLDQRLFNAIPNYLTGLGILGTFMGLAYSMSHFKNLTGGDISMDVVKYSFDELLKGAGFAFVTSIVGILLSIIFSSFEKEKIRTVKEKIDYLNEILDSATTLVSAEHLIAERSKSSERNEAEMIDTGKSIIASLYDLNTEIKELRIQRQLETNKLVKEISENFIDELKKVSFDNIEESSKKFNEATTALTSVTQKFDEIGSDLRVITNDTKNTVYNMNSVTDKVAQTVESFEKINSLTRQSTEQLERTIVNKAKDVDRIFTSVIESIEKSENKQESFLSTLTNQLDDFYTKQLEAVNHWGEEHRKIFENVDDNVKVYTDQIATGFQEFRRLQSELFMKISDQIGLFNDKLLDNFDKTNGLFESSSNNIQSKLTELFDKSRLKIDELLKTLEDKFNNTEENIKDHINSLTNKFQGIYDDILKNTTETRTQHSKLFENMNEQIAVFNKNLLEVHTVGLENQKLIYSNLTSNAKELTKSFENIMKSTEDDVKKSFGIFKDGVNETKDIYNLLTSQINQLTSAWKTSSDNFEKTENIISNMITELQNSSDKNIDASVKFFTRIDDSYAKSLTILSSAIERMEENISHFDNTADKFNISIEKLDQSSEHKKIENLYNQINKALLNTLDLLSPTVNDIEKVTANFKEKINQLVKIMEYAQLLEARNSERTASDRERADKIIDDRGVLITTENIRDNEGLPKYDLTETADDKNKPPVSLLKD